MMQPIVTRTQRRVESKQVILIAVLVVAVAGVSFVLGVLYGQQGGERLLAGGESDRPRLPMATQIAPPPPPPQPALAVETEKLTFYDTLPKGNQAPLGSGINLPPEAKKPEPRPEVKAGAKSETSRTVEAAAAPPPSVSVQVAPVVKSEGRYVVQVASYRTREDAQKLMKRLEGYRLKPFVETADLGQKGVWQRVFAGPFPSRESADQAVLLLKEKERLNALVRQR